MEQPSENPKRNMFAGPLRAGLAASMLMISSGDGLEVSLSTPTPTQNPSTTLHLSDQELQTLQKGREGLPYKAFLPGIAAGENTILSGANTHIAINNEPMGYTNLETFREQVDLLRSYNQTEIRFGIPRWEAAQLSSDKKNIVWNENELSYFRDAVRYAESRGLEVFLVTTPPSVPDDFNLDQYLEITKQFYERVGNEFPEVIHQPGNEYDTHNIRNYGDYGHPINDRELSEYGRWLDVATRSLRHSNSLVKVTQSLNGYPINEATMQEWVRVNTIIGPHLDFYSLNTYPSNIAEARKLEEFVLEFERRSGKKDSVVAEVGLPTYQGYSMEFQKQILLEAIKTYKDAGRKMLIYEIQDENFNDVQGHFGIIDKNGNPKPAFAPVMTELQKEGKPSR